MLSATLFWLAASFLDLKNPHTEEFYHRKERQMSQREFLSFSTNRQILYLALSYARKVLRKSVLFAEQNNLICQLHMARFCKKTLKHFY